MKFASREDNLKSLSSNASKLPSDKLPYYITSLSFSKAYLMLGPCCLNYFKISSFR